MNTYLKEGRLFHGIATRLQLGDGDVVILASSEAQLQRAAELIHPGLVIKSELCMKAIIVSSKTLEGGGK